MNKIRIGASILLGLGFLLSGAIYFIHPFPLPPNDGSINVQTMLLMHQGGLMGLIAFSHIVAGLLLLIPRTSFLGAMLQLPMTIGILSYNMTMSHQAIVVSVVLLLINLIALADPSRLRAIVS